MFLTAVLTAIAGEFKVIPFSGEGFRFGLGSATFFLLILVRQPASYVHAGFLTGIIVVIFRLLVDIFSYPYPFSFLLSLREHFPAFFFYLFYAWGLSRLPIDKFHSNPLRLGLMAAGLEFSVNTGEHLLRSSLLDSMYTFSLREWLLLSLVALFRSYFVIGLYSSIRVPEQQKRMQQMLQVASGLYGETLYLQKSMENTEKITASSHDLYRKLKDSGNEELGKHALSIAQQIHEVKKDSQRILAGLSKLYSPEKTPEMSISQVLYYTIKANENYSEMLGKKIHFQLQSSVEWETDKQIPLLSVLNNLVANAVESVDQEGRISIEVLDKEVCTWFIVEDTGSGIVTEDLALIFEPGFTTKFNEKGVGSTGIGLSHVKEIIRSWDGEWDVISTQAGTSFQIKIPTKNIRKGT